MGRVLFYFLVSFGVAGCLHSPSVKKLQVPAKVQVVLLRDHVHERTASPVPESVQEEIGRVLKERNLVPEFSDPSLLKDLGGIRDTSTRLRQIANRSSEKGSLLLLVETKVRFYSQLSGRYRWSVSVSLSLAPVDKLAEVHSAQFTVPAVLSYAHEKENEALLSAGSDIARRLGLLADDFLAGKKTLTDNSVKASPVVLDPDEMHGVYFVLVDRFANGDKTNDEDTDLDDAEAWHGGDLKGVMQHLDYIRNLGVDTIWLSPVFLSQKEKFLGHGAFHGYWVMDSERIDPRFGSLKVLEQLTDESHKRGLKVLLDLVVNHVAYKSPLLAEHPDWFHHRGTIKDWKDREQLINNEVHGLPDLAQENPEVFSCLLSTADKWLREVGVDGFRLDAVKHVSLDFWKRFNSALERKKPGVILLGEHYDGDPAKVDHVQREGHFSYMFDFPMAFALKDVFCSQKAAGKLAAVLSNDRLYERPEHLVTFLDNHDLERIRTACGGDLSKVRQAMNAQFAVRGVPALTYGTEVGLCGAGEPENRADMVFMGGPSFADLGMHIKKLFELRRENPVLERGKTRIVSYDKGLLLFIRVLENSAVLVAVNSRDTAARCSLPLDGVEAKNLLSGQELEDSFEIMPGHTDLFALKETAPGVFGLLYRQQSGAREIKVFVKAQCSENTSLSMVGSGPELGQWNPEHALGPFLKSPEGLSLSFSLPVGLVFSFKLISRTRNGEIKWEQGADRYLFVQKGQGPLTLRLNLLEC